MYVLTVKLIHIGILVCCIYIEILNQNFHQTRGYNVTRLGKDIQICIKQLRCTKLFDNGISVQKKMFFFKNYFESLVIEYC